jgi:putative ABC transport system ATP-binding protein
MGNGGAAIAVRGLQKSYVTGGVRQAVLTGVDLDVEAGRFVSIMGPSGSGKSTLLHLLAGLDVPDAGEVHLGGARLSSLSDDERTDLRRTAVGIVYQFFNLVPVLTVEENIALPAVIAGARPSSYEARLREVVDLVGLGDHRGKQPSALSGGQQQRAAIARALFIEPDVLLADEPTGNLDLGTGAEILQLITQVQADLGQTVVMVTHDPRSAAHGDDVLLLRDGTVVDRLSVGTKARGAARTDRAHPNRSKSVLRWLEDLDATGSVASRSSAV